MLAELTWLTSGPVTGPLWGSLGVVAGSFLGAALGLFWIWMLADIYRSKKLSTIARVVWFMFVLFTLIGAFVYAFVHPPKLNRKSAWFKISVAVMIIACLPAAVAAYFVMTNSISNATNNDSNNQPVTQLQSPTQQ